MGFEHSQKTFPPAGEFLGSCRCSGVLEHTVQTEDAGGLHPDRKAERTSQLSGQAV